MATEPQFVRFDEMAWPTVNPSVADDIGWRLRYGTPTQTDCYFAAAVIRAYQALVNAPEVKRRNVVRKLRLADGD